MDNNFRVGFEKIAYDYEYEARRGENRAKTRQEDTPIKWTTALGIGGAGGAALGALASSKGMRLPGAGMGALAGAALGGLIGIADRADIEDSKYIMGLDEDERRELLKYRARKSELAKKEFREEMRHEDLKDAFRGGRSY